MYHLHSILMTHNIVVSIKEFLEDNYPNLTYDQIDLIASDVKQRWDYQPILDQIEMQCEKTAYYANIELSTKPSFATPENKV